ncbi:hypothetical protein MKW92_038128 [Papaver armeniacum]|nr:hypothetical protein MKW92_038128 [Papaver armeniacum]
MMDEMRDGGLDVNGRKLSFELAEISELASEDPIVNAGAPDSCAPEELRMLKVSLSFLCFFEFVKVERLIIMNSFQLNFISFRIIVIS